MTYARRAWIILWKDLLIERRAKETANALLFFCLLLLFLFQFALGPDRERLATAVPGLLWLGFILAGLLGLGRSFLAERDNDCWEGLRLTPGDKSAIYLGKLAGNCVLMTAVEIILVVLFGVFYNVDLWTPAAPLTLVLALGTIGLAAVGTLFAAMTAQVRARELLFPVLLLPVQVPVLLATVSATQAVLLGQPLADVAHWLKLLAGADLVYVTIGLLTFEFVLEG
ncbi:MAG TPA: heme exporter protein CcmB [Candidatus Deferrimicrobiaceae bacterium]|nr:heme exporter protein CcmB [Candidatus Deferrimicrobiaceae bacterium]